MNDLMSILECVKEANVFPRLKWFGLLNPCTRCGGSGHYSYNAMTGTTCFRCNGQTVEMPKVTPAFLERVRKEVTPERLQEYRAHLQRVNEGKKLVEAGSKLYIGANVHARLKTLCRIAGIKEYWMDECDYADQNYPELVRVKDEMYKILTLEIEPLTRRIGPKGLWNAKTKVWEPLDYAAVGQTLAPMIERMRELDK